MISVIFASHNGEKTLPIMLDAFCGLEKLDCEWEIIIIDNASTDKTPEIIQNFKNRLPIKYLYEQNLGKNNAINTGLSIISGDLIVFTDDDIIPKNDWLIRFYDCAVSHPEFSIFGGAIFPVWPYEPNQQLLDSIPLDIAFGATDPAINEGEVSPNLVFGANMAVRRHAISDVGSFDNSVGPKGNHYPMGSETEFVVRLANIGHKSWFCPSASVGHIIRNKQLSSKWLIGRAFKFGRGQSIRGKFKLDSAKGIFGIPFWLFKKVLLHSIKSYFHHFKRQNYDYLKEAWLASFYKGYIYQLYLLNKNVANTKYNNSTF